MSFGKKGKSVAAQKHTFTNGLFMQIYDGSSHFKAHNPRSQW